jgi:hypothetical protein
MPLPEPTRFALCKCGHRLAVHAGSNGCFPNMTGASNGEPCGCKAFEEQATHMDLMNRQCVALRPSDNRVFIHRASDIMLVGLTAAEALNLAAWLVAIADGRWLAQSARATDRQRHVESAATQRRPALTRAAVNKKATGQHLSVLAYRLSEFCHKSTREFCACTARMSTQNEPTDQRSGR